MPRDAYETVSAFANTEGGHLVFGVRKSGREMEIVGVLDVDKVQSEFLSTLPLIDAGIIRMTNPDRHNAADQRYVLTETGVALKAARIGAVTGSPP